MKVFLPSACGWCACREFYFAKPVTSAAKVVRESDCNLSTKGGAASLSERGEPVRSPGTCGSIGRAILFVWGLAASWTDRMSGFGCAKA